jgi:hypothetical protein
LLLLPLNRVAIENCSYGFIDRGEQKPEYLLSTNIASEEVKYISFLAAYILAGSFGYP